MQEEWFSGSSCTVGYGHSIWLLGGVSWFFVIGDWKYGSLFLSDLWSRTEYDGTGEMHIVLIILKVSREGSGP